MSRLIPIFFILILLFYSDQNGVYLPVNFKESKTQFVTPEQFGGNGFDTNLDTVSLQKAIDTGKTILLKEKATYFIDKPLVINHSLFISTAGKIRATIVQKEKHSAIIVQNKKIAFTHVSESISKNQKFIKVDNTNGMKIGDLLHLRSSKLWKWDNRGYLCKGETHKIRKIIGNKVYFERSIADSYNNNKETLTVEVYPKMKVNISNLQITHPKPYNTTMIEVNHTTDSKFFRLSITNSKKTGLWLNETFHSTILDSHFSLGSSNKELGYGIQDYGGTDTIVSNSIFKKCRRGVDFSGDTPSRFGLVSGSKAYGSPKGTLAAGNSGFGTHSTAEEITFEKNYIDGFHVAFFPRGNHIHIINNIVTNTEKAVVSSSYGFDLEVKQNKYENSSPKNGINNFVIVHKDFEGRLIIVDNQADLVQGDFVWIDTPKVTSLSIIGNQATIRSDKPNFFLVGFNGTKFKIKNSIIFNNQFKALSGNKLYLSPNINISDKTNKIE